MCWCSQEGPRHTPFSITTCYLHVFLHITHHFPDLFFLILNFSGFNLLITFKLFNHRDSSVSNPTLRLHALVENFWDKQGRLKTLLCSYKVHELCWLTCFVWTGYSDNEVAILKVTVEVFQHCGIGLHGHTNRNVKISCRSQNTVSEMYIAPQIFSSTFIHFH